jgi:hypothetical protein
LRLDWGTTLAFLSNADKDENERTRVAPTTLCRRISDRPERDAGCHSCWLQRQDYVLHRQENLKKPEIGAVLEAKRARIAEENKLTVEIHLEERRRLRDSACETGQYGAAIQAEVERGEVVGFDLKRRENVTQLSPDERAERVTQLLGLAKARAANRP